MTTDRIYKNAPITEAIIDIHVAHSVPPAIETLRSAFETERGIYPEETLLNIGTFQFGKLTASSATTENLGYAFRAVDAKNVAQFRTNGFTFSRLNPYEHWKSFRDEAHRLWAIYRNVLKPEMVTRAAVRYINRIELPLAAGDLSNWLNTYPQLAEDVSTTLSAYFMALTTPQPEVGGTLQLIETVEPPKDAGAILVLDLDLYRDENVPQIEDDLWEYFEQLRQRKNRIFEACITDRTRELFV